MEKNSNKKKILIIAVIAVLLLLALLFGLNRCGKGVKTDGITVYESQDNSNAIPQYDENSEHVFSFIPAESQKGDITYELISAKDQEFKEVNYFTLVSENDTQIKVAKGTPAGTYTLTIRCYAGDNKNEYKDITYIYKIDKAASSYTIEPSGIAGLVYNGEEQELVKPGTASYGTIYYKVNDGEWSQEIPKATDAGIYTVSYKLVGDQNHADIKEKSIMVSIDRKTVAYKPGVSLSSSFSLSDMKNYIKEKSSEAANKNVPVSGKPAGLVEYEYDGNTHSNGYLPPRGIKKMGEDIGTDAGTYVAVYYPDTNYCWSDGTRNPVSVTLVIHKKKVAVPTADEPLEYTGEEQTLTLINFDETVMSVRGNTGTAVGQYRAIVSLNDRKNYSWSDGTVLDKIITWHIVARSVNVPYVETVFTFNGMIQRVKESDMGDFDPSIMRIVSGNYGTVAKDYEMKVALRDKKNYVWNDEEGGTDNRTIVWTIHPYSVGPKPEDPEPVAYDGLYHNNGYDQPYGVSHTGGKEGGREVGEYTATYKPRPDYCWDDGTNDEVSITLSVVKGEAEYIKEPSAREDLTYNGRSLKLMYDGKAKGGTISYKIGEDGRWGEDGPEVINSGKYTVYYKIFGDKNHEDSETSSVQVEVKKATPKLIKEPTIHDWPYDGEEHQLTEGGEAKGGTIYYIYNGEELEAVYGTEKGDYVFEAHIRPEDDNWEDVNLGNRTAHIGDPVKEAQFTTKPVAIESDYNGEPQELLSEKGETSDGRIWYSLDNERWSNEVPVATDAGVYNVWFYIEGDEAHLDSRKESVKAEIKQIKATATVESSSTVYTGQPQDLINVTTEDGTLSYSLTGWVYHDEVPQKTKAGEYTVYYKITGDKNHLDTYEAKNCVIEKADIEYNAESKEYDYEKGKAHGIVVTAKTVDGSNADIRYGTKEGSIHSRKAPLFEEVGVHTVYFTIKAANHNDVEGSYTIRVKASDPKFTVEPASLYGEGNEFVYNGSYQDLISAGKTKDGVIEYKVDYTKPNVRSATNSEWSRSLPKALDAGTYVISYRILGDESHNDKEWSNAITIVMEQAYPVVEEMPDVLETVYDGEYHQLISGGKVNGGELYFEYKGEVIYDAADIKEKDPGEYEIELWIKAANDNYQDEVHFDTAIAVIKTNDEPDYVEKPKAVKLDFNNEEQKLVDGGKAVNGQIYYSLDPQKEWSTDVPTGKDAENYYVYYKVVSDDGQKQTPVSCLVSVIRKVKATATIESVTTYTGKPQDLLKATTEDGTLSYSMTGWVYHKDVPQRTDAGEYTVYYKIKGDKNHNDTYEAVTCTIEPAEVEYAPRDGEVKTFDYKARMDHSVPVTVKTVDGYTDMDKLHVKITYGEEPGVYTTTRRPGFRDVGTYPVYFKIEADNHNTVEDWYVVEIKEAAATYKTEPKAVGDLVYNGKAQNLLMPGKTNDGTILYSLERGEWSETVPQATEAKTYNVSYMIKGDENHSDSNVTNVEVTIAKADPEMDKDNVPTGINVVFDGTDHQLLANPGKAINGKIRYEFGNLVTYNAAEVVADNACAKGDDGKLIPYEIKITIVGDPNYNNVEWGVVKAYITPSGETTYITKPTAKDLTFNGNAQELINPGETVDGTIRYRIEPNGRWSDNVPTAMNAGKYLIGYYIEGDSDHEDTKKEFVEAEIKKADWTVNVVRNTTTYTGNAQELVEITADGGDVLYSNKGIVFTNIVPKAIDVGDYKIHYIVSKDKNHNETKGTVECSITPATLSYNADSKTFTYDPRADHRIIVTVRTVDGYTDMDKRHVTISYGREEGDYTTTKAPMFHDAGVYEVFFQIEAENHVTVRSSYTITIEQADNVFDAPTGLELKYTGSEQALVTEGRVYTPGAELLYSTDGGKTYSDSVPKAADAGEYYVYYKCVNSDPNYKDSSVLASVRSEIIEAVDDQNDDLDNVPAPVDGTAVDGVTPGSNDDQGDDSSTGNNDQLPTLEDIITQDPVYDNDDQAVGDNNDQLPNLENDGTQGQEDNYVEPQGSAEPQSGLMMAQNVIMQVVPTVYDHDIFRIGANIQSIDILDQRDNFGNAVTFFSEDGKQIIRSPLAPAGTYIIEAKVKIAWIVDENGQAQAIILDSDIEKPVEEAIGADDNYAYQYYQQAVAEAQQNYDYDDDDDNDQTPQIVTPEVTAPQDNSSLDVEEFLEEEEDSDPNSEVFYENKQDESDEQPAEGAE